MTQLDSENKHAIELNFRSFESQILYFNGMYKLPAPNYPTPFVIAANERQKLITAGMSSFEISEVTHTNALVLLDKRMRDFKRTLLNEIEEVEDIIQKIGESFATPQGEEPKYSVEDFLTDMADWLGDIQVYCASEMVKYGLPNNDVLGIIMQSNFSKLQLDGTTKYDEAGKVEKGPLYWKPEPKIKELILKLQESANK